jgi:hypothetical protein
MAKTRIVHLLTSIAGTSIFRSQLVLDIRRSGGSLPLVFEGVMDSFRFDFLARLVATQTPGPTARSRRQVLRAAAAGIASTVLVSRSSPPASAALCPNRVPRRNYRPTINGCGPSGYGWIIPDSYGEANFTPACNRHDRCYGTCNESRLKCDFLMRKSMQAACKRAYPGKANTKVRRKCNGRARFYFNKVSAHGLSAFEDAQSEACTCCSPGAPACGDTCCPPAQFCYACIGGTCQSTCGQCQFCNQGVCEDCGVGCCGG